MEREDNYQISSNREYILTKDINIDLYNAESKHYFEHQGD